MKWGWSIDENHWDNLEEFVNKYHKNISWKHIDANYRLSHNVPDQPGVYSFNAQRLHNIKGKKLRYPYLYDDNLETTNSLMTPIYIGISDNLRSRFKQHLTRNESIQKAIKTFSNPERTSLIYSWTEFPAEICRDYERFLIAAFGPTLNNQG
jgi:excinuclease UvrABC nuclease subunit